MKEIPAISVIIPLYNVEKYIGECLDSLLAQTFQNFEVIVVDDCSTDNSPAIVKSYIPKFNGRLRLASTKKNSGSGTLPRNIGLAYSRGEYIFFMDNDDAVTPTAFEELYFLAKKFNADVVHCEKFYHVPIKLWDNANFRKNLKPTSYLTGEKIFFPKPVLLSDKDMGTRIKIFSERKLIWNFWVQLVRHDFIIENSLKPVGIIADDMIFTISELCCAKVYVVVPNVIYFYRYSENSLMHKKTDPEKQIYRCITMLRSGIEYLDEILKDNEFFLRRPDLKYVLLNTFTEEILRLLNGVYAQIPVYAIDELLRREFGADSAFESFIFNLMNVNRLQLMQMQNQFNRFAAQAQQRIAQLENELKRIKQQ